MILYMLVASEIRKFPQNQVIRSEIVDADQLISNIDETHRYEWECKILTNRRNSNRE